MINVYQPQLGKEELNAVKQVFKSNWIGKGKKTEEFETNFAEHLSVSRNRIRSTTCCTEALFQILQLLGIGAGDEVIMPTISFVGAGNAVAACGAKNIFCDVDYRTLNATAEFIAAKITPRTKAIILIHYGGISCEMDEIVNLIKGRNITLIEDSACSVASKYKNRSLGTIGDFGVWSFDAMKILVCGDGAMVYCANPEDSTKIEQQAYLGLITKSGFTNTVDNKWWEFDISGFGRRAIMNDISSAIGIEQLHKLPSFIKKRKKIHDTYMKELKNIEWFKLPPALPDYIESSYYFFWLQMKPEIRSEFALYLRSNNIYTTFRYYPLHWVKKYGVSDNLPNAEKAANETLCIPIHHSLTNKDIAFIVEKIKSFEVK